MLQGKSSAVLKNSRGLATNGKMVIWRNVKQNFVYLLSKQGIIWKNGHACIEFFMVCWRYPWLMTTCCARCEIFASFIGHMEV